MEGPGLDLLAGPGDADDDGLAPASVTALERLSHDLDIANAFKRIVGAALGQIDQILDQIAANLGRVDEMGHAEFLGQWLFARIDIDPDDHVGADQFGALDHVQTDPAQAEDNDRGAGLDARRVDHRAKPGGHARIALFQGLTYGTIAPKVVTHPMHLLIELRCP